MRVFDGRTEDAPELWSLVPLECYMMAAAIFITAAFQLLLPLR